MSQSIFWKRKITSFISGTRWPWLIMVVMMALGTSACETCVSGLVTIAQEPVSDAWVEVLDGEGIMIGETQTSPEGEYCIGGLPMNNQLTIRVWVNGIEMVETVQSGTYAAECGMGRCQRVDIAFSCDIEDPLEPNDTIDSAVGVTLPYSNLLTALCPPGDVDLYRFKVAEDGMAVLAETYYPGEGIHLDSFLGLLDATGNVLAYNDDSAGGLYSVLGVPLPGAGTYYIAVSGCCDQSFQGHHNRTGA